MALNAALEELLGTLPAEDQGVLRSQLEKHKALGEGFLRQEDYDRQMNSSKAKLRQAAIDREWIESGEGSKLIDKADTNYRFYEEQKTRAEALERQLAEKTNAAAAAAGVDPTELAKTIRDQILAGNAHLTADGIATMVRTEATKLAEVERKSFLEQTFPASIQFTSEMTEAQLRYKDESGKYLDRKEFARYMTENGIGSPLEALEKFTAPARQEALITKAKQQAIDDFLKENPSIPGSGVHPSNDLGPLQTRLKTDAASGAGAFGANAAANALMQQGKF